MRINDSNTIKELENQAKNIKSLMDQLNKAYIGLTVDELIRLALTKPETPVADEEDAPTKNRPMIGGGEIESINKAAARQTS